jgi:hypothetical protein
MKFLSYLVLSPPALNHLALCYRLNCTALS